LAYHCGLAVLFLGRLIDREHADVRQDDLRDGDLRLLGMLLIFLTARQQHIDPIVRENEAACASLRRDLGRDRAHAAWQDGRHETGAVGLYQLLFADRLACDEWGARERAGELVRRVGTLSAANEGAARGRRRPCLPLQVLELERLPEPNFGFRNED